MDHYSQTLRYSAPTRTVHLLYSFFLDSYFEHWFCCRDWRRYWRANLLCSVQIIWQGHSLGQTATFLFPVSFHLMLLLLLCGLQENNDVHICAPSFYIHGLALAALSMKFTCSRSRIWCSEEVKQKLPVMRKQDLARISCCFEMMMRLMTRVSWWQEVIAMMPMIMTMMMICELVQVRIKLISLCFMEVPEGPRGDI